MGDYDVSEGLLSCYLMDFEAQHKKDALGDLVIAERFAVRRHRAAANAGDVDGMNKAWEELLDIEKRKAAIIDELEAHCLVREAERQKRLRKCVFELPRPDDTGWDAPFGIPDHCRMCGRTEAEHGKRGG